MNIDTSAQHPTRIGGMLALVALAVLAGCSTGGAGYGAKAGSAPPAAAAAAGSGHDLGVRRTSLGTIIVDGRGMTAYIYTKDTPGSGRSACTGPCLTLWPPIVAAGSKPVVDGVTGTVGTITTAGERQVTVDGLPLYTYAPDTVPGDVTGQGVGSAWYVLSPDGTVVGRSGGTRGY